MKSDKKWRVTFVVLTGLIVGASVHAKKPDDVDVLGTCKADCPNAKNNAEAHECVERKAKIRPSYKKTKCWEVNEEYEELIKVQIPSKK